MNPAEEQRSYPSECVFAAPFSLNCPDGSGYLEHDPENCKPGFREDYAQSKTQSAMTIRPNLVALRGPPGMTGAKAPVLEQHNRVSSYFDDISHGYSDRYGDQNPFHSYFFRERLKAATDHFVFDRKTVLDIGAGTGALYQELIRQCPTLDYFACDISPQMLAQSAIPPDRAFVGRVSEISFPRDSFDFIYSLGVTTYQDPAELAANWRFIADRLAPGGTAIISFTNRTAIDHAVRTAMRIAKPIVKRGVFGQSFATFAYRPGEVAEMARGVGLRIARITFLNQTVSPFNTLLPKPSVMLARAIERRAPAALLPFLSADFVVFAERA